ncbi:MAG: STAS domain-containing protein [Kiloniellales bacterium]|nr:STAS domain-containing protein [Kiloniellales bacterium]
MISILQLGEVLVTSIQTDLVDEAALGFQADLLKKVGESHAEGVVIDITALDVVDTYMARIINETANMARLLGADVVLTGMQPSVALTLVEMGRELIGVETAMSLEQGIQKLQHSRAGRHGHTPEGPEGGDGEGSS